ncbi:adenylate/guanylate cyclase domain-containing protein [Pukyongiella litopenaei]|uniref:Adenylate/guanylate cyclase domain-containing protein n=1 Tax=Pukyongiella litopenaei TaxID=2605946 RepID=A0A2S0MLT6_9RHOB|nr:adenylate/guanylate cyclase domain-containing protein [Pukyongiella litopenaei]AVO36850.1 adenylate/guanylate cyclase domain-containing protein [Pukyongiella litopenaei]
MIDHFLPETPDDDPAARLNAWLLREGLHGAGQEALLEGYCGELVGLGVPLMRLHLAQRALHPEFGGIGFDWLRGGAVSQETYAHSDTPRDRWLQSPLFAVLRDRLPELRIRLDRGDPLPFPMLNDLRDRGGTDYFASAMTFEDPGAVGRIDPHDPPEGFLISWTTDAPGGFRDADLTLLRRTLPQLGLALKSAANRRMGRDLLGVYLGRDAGRRVLTGEIRRGSLQQIRAVICYFDLTGFTRLAEETGGAALIDMLNDYFGIVVGLVQGQGGHVLKFMGDGLLAMFEASDPQAAARAALDMADRLRRDMATRSAERRARGEPATGFTLALHAGDILYGNIGAETRLDFTAIGPAVNQTARISGMHRAVGQDIILSERVMRDAGRTGHDLVSLGRYMLRGVSAPQELFTLHARPEGGNAQKVT